MRSDQRHIEFHQGRGRDGGQDDIGGRCRNARTHDNAGDGDKDQSEEQCNAFLRQQTSEIQTDDDGSHVMCQLHDRARELEAQPGQCGHAQQEANARTGGTNGKREFRAVLEAAHQTGWGQNCGGVHTGVPQHPHHQRHVAEGNRQDDAPEGGEERGVLHQQHCHHHTQRYEQVPRLFQHSAELWDLVFGKTFETQLLGLEVDHQQNRDVVEAGGDNRDEDEFVVGNAQHLGHDKGRGPHDRWRDLSAARS